MKKNYSFGTTDTIHGCPFFTPLNHSDGRCDIIIYAEIDSRYEESQTERQSNI